MSHLIHLTILRKHMLNLLRVVRRKAYEYHNRHVAHNPIESLRAEEDVNHRSDDYTYQCHKENASKTCEVHTCEVSEQAHHEEHSRSDEEHRRNGTHRIDHKYRRHRNTHQRRVEDKKQRCRGHRHTCDAC